MAGGLNKQLVGELKRSPKKAAILGLLAGVALYFWAPLFFSLGKSDQQPKAGDRPVATANPVRADNSAAAVAAENGPDTSAWRKLREVRESDSRMESQSTLRIEHDPFEQPAADPDEQPARPDVIVDAAQEETTPESLGLVLTGTLVGPRRQVALISGRAYSIGEQVAAEDGTTFIVRQITPRDVVLDRQGRHYILSRSSGTTN